MPPTPELSCLYNQPLRVAVAFGSLRTAVILMPLCPVKELLRLAEEGRFSRTLKNISYIILDPKKQSNLCCADEISGLNLHVIATGLELGPREIPIPKSRDFNVTQSPQYMVGFN